ncbi:alpha/beta fold hydrolase [Nonomuraea sp. NPDC050547]|uniref:alpha/beta fold hydrolase n=1 Tax=Nonomuraea sp. NPDC050547 TaxID=3364368 RepID=UPI0037A78CBF
MNHIQGTTEWVPTRDGRRLHAMVLPGPEPAAAPVPEAMTTPGPEPTTAAGPMPTVVFEAGAAVGRSSWALVQPAVGAFARAIVYDRAGLGRSPADPVSRTLRRMAGDLGDLLDHFGAGPYVLVGHSAGGPIVRLAAAARPERVAGLVLVDPADEAADVLFSPAFRRVERVVVRVNLLLAHLGLLGFAYRSTMLTLPRDARRDMRREAFTAAAVRTHRAQVRTFLDELATWRIGPPHLGDLPVTVVSGGRAGNGMPASTRAAANAAHAHRASRSPAGRHVIAPRSGHYVPLTDPEVVVTEVARLLRP